MSFEFAVERWRTWVDRVQLLALDPFPVDLVLKWIAMESSGNECSVGIIENGFYREAGLSQIDFGKPPGVVRYGVTSAQLRAKCDGRVRTADLDDAERVMHAKSAVDDANAARSKARAKLSAVGVSWSESSFDFWCFVKLSHALPATYAMLGPAKKAGAAGSWAEFRAYVLADQARLDQFFEPNRSVDNVAHWMDTCEEFASVGYDPPSRWKVFALFGGILALFGLGRRFG